MRSDPKPVDVSKYSEGDDRYIRFIEEVLGVRLSATQRRIITAVTSNQRVIVVSGNGVGKSYVVACLILAFVLTNLDSTVLGTSGSYSQFRDTMWKPLRKIFKQAGKRHLMPGQVRRGNPPRLEIDDDWYAKAISPRDPGDLEGRHDDHVLVVIEEADKKYITDEHFDSAGSSITDLNDRIVGIANPPDDETDVTYQKMQSDRWETIRFSTFEAHNVLVDAGLLNEERIPGITDLITVASDFEEWNGEPWPRTDEVYDGQWPGMSQVESWLEDGEYEREDVLAWLRPGYHVAKDLHNERTDLDERWYKRRAGIIPPAGADVHRPVYTDDVNDASRGNVTFGSNRYGIGVDIGRTGDSTVVCSVRKINDGSAYGIYVRTDQDGERTHGDNEAVCRAAMEDGPLFGIGAVDAMGEGSGVADQMVAEYDQFERFDAGMKPVTPKNRKEYKNRRTEALALFGEFLRGGGKVVNTRLQKELYAASRVIQYNRRRSEGRNVFAASSKDEIKDQIGRSPDVLDAAAIAVWSFEGAHEKTIREVSHNERKAIESTW